MEGPVEKLQDRSETPLDAVLFAAHSALFGVRRLFH